MQPSSITTNRGYDDTPK